MKQFEGLFVQKSCVVTVDIVIVQSMHTDVQCVAHEQEFLQDILIVSFKTVYVQMVYMYMELNGSWSLNARIKAWC